ncbi:MAG: hypothetical protein E7279_01510 [Lachnospiraceae bacterium]|nr:hypothetical protein [Lachnospiraceae bacterium]
MKKKKTVLGSRKQFEKLKRAESLINEHPKSAQDIIEILQLAPNGLFKVGKNKWSKSYELVDVNYTPKTFDEQLSFFSEWYKTINSFDVHIKITVFNRNRNMELIENEILYQHHNDDFDWLRDSYNDIIENKIFEGKNGVEQVKILTICVEKENYEEAKASISTLESNFISNFVSLGSNLVPLSTNERLRLLYNFYHCGDENIFNLDINQEIINGRNYKDYIAPNYIDFNNSVDSFETDRFVGSCYYIEPSSYPRKLTDNLFINLTNNSFVSCFTIDFVPVSQDITYKTLENKLLGIENKIVKQQDKRNRTGNYSSDISYKVRREKEELEDMLDHMREDDQKMFWVGVSFVVCAENEEKLKNNINVLKQITEKETLEIAPYFSQQREALNTILPYGVRQVNKLRSLFTSSAGALMPFNVLELQQTDHPFYYGINQISKEPIFANRKKSVNGNGFVFGVPGGGKSFTGCKMEIGSVFLNTEDDIIVVDPTLEYFDVAEAYNGQIINLSTATKHHMNPLVVDLERLQVDMSDGQVREKSEFMLGLVDQAMEGGMKPAHKTLVDRAIRILFDGIASKPISQRKQPIMSDFVEILKQQEEKESRDIVIALELFTEGGLNIFNHQSNVNINNRVIVYGLRDLGENLTGVAMLVMLENIRQRIIENSQKGVATWLYIDEFHVVLGKKYSRDYLISLWKKVRKLGGLCTGITQNVVEVLKDPMTSTLVSNSEYTCFLKQAEPDVIALKTAFPNISDAQLRYVALAQPGTGLIRFGNIVIPFNNVIEKDNPVYAIYNTNLHEKIAMKKAKGYK